MNKSFRKRDRTARLLKLQILLWQHRSGLEVEDIAHRCSISQRTVYRDLEALESELNVPIWQDGGKRGIAEDYFLPPITFSQAEAVSIFLAARMMQYFSPQCHSSVASMFMKLNTIVTPLLQHQIKTTIERLEKIPEESRKTNNFDRLIQAWLSRHPVTIRYLELYEKEPVKYIIEPYFIEPIARNRSNYVIAFCRLQKLIKTFKIDRIIGEVTIEPDTYEIPVDFNINNYLSSAWGPYADGKVEIIKLRFSKRIGQAIMQTKFHPSQSIEVQSDGTVIMTLKVHNTGDFRAWVLGWGRDVEALQPEVLRNQIIEDIKSLTDVYGVRSKKNRHRNGKLGDLDNELIEISDKVWNHISPLLPLQSHTGRPRINDRQVLNGILNVHKMGIVWRDIPRKYGAPSTCYSRFKQWKSQGVWDKIWGMVSEHEFVQKIAR